MRTQEVKSSDWPVFCNRFTEHQKDGLLNIEEITPEGKATTIANDVQLIEAKLVNEACNDVVRLTLRTEAGRELVHRITEPIHLKIRESNGRKILEIIAESGTTLLRFHSAKLPQMLEGLHVS